MPPPGAGYNSVRSSIWVGVGLMKRAQFSFPLAPVRETAGIDFVQAAAREMHLVGCRDSRTPLRHG